MDSHFGIKKLTEANWLEPDEVSRTALARLTPEGETILLDQTDYLHAILKPQLSPKVPDDVKRLFEVARGVMVYGWYFYPLFTLGAEQCYRVVEAAVGHRYQQAGGKRSVRSGKRMREFKLSEKLNWLVKKSIIPKEKESLWQSLRALRNMASHPEHQSIYDPAMSVNMLHHCAEDINSLFRA
jgi:hypothetical protein